MLCNILCLNLFIRTLLDNWMVHVLTIAVDYEMFLQDKSVGVKNYLLCENMHVIIGRIKESRRLKDHLI